MLGRAFCVGVALVCSTAPAKAPSVDFVKPGPVAPGGCREPGTDPPLPANAPPNSTYLAAEKPIPERFAHGKVSFRINIVSVDEANRVCAGGVPVCRRVFYACTSSDGKTLTMPNPCEYPQTDAYAKLLCHETAHLRGWPAYHGD